jgi:hypothetical protein
VVGPRWKTEAKRACFRVSVLQVLLKSVMTCGKGEQGDSHPIINEWGGAWAVPEPKQD